MPTYEGTIRDTGGAVFDVRSSIYAGGATGNGVTDDTAAIQAAVNAAGLVRGTVLIPPGTYVVTSVILKPGIRVSGYGATLFRPANTPNWTRMLTVPESGTGSWGGATDSAPLVIEGLTLDGNSANQGTYRNYAQEQSHLIFLSADGAQAGRLRATLRDLVLKNSVADGVQIYRNVDAQIVDCRADDCFRGGVVVGGGYTIVQVQNLITTGNTDRTGIDIEPDGAGYGNTLATRITLDGLVLDGDFDIAAPAGSTILVNDVISGPAFYLEAAADSTVRISNSRFQLDAGGATIVFPHDVVFQDCKFELAAGTRAVNVQWNGLGAAPEHQRLRFRDCDFTVTASVATAGTAVAIHTEPDYPARDNQLYVEGGSVAKGYGTAMQMGQGGIWIVKDVEINAATAFDWNARNTDFGDLTHGRIRIERVFFDGTKYMHVANRHTANVLDQRDVLLEEAQNVITSSYGLQDNQYRGGRLIRVGSTPIGRSVPGFIGDVARLTPPAAGTAYEWVCTASSETAATWKLVTSAAA